MRELLANPPVSFGRPGWLLGLAVVLPILLWVSWSSLSGLGKFRRTLATLLRFAVVTLLVLALADMRSVRRSETLTALFLLDASESGYVPAMIPLAGDYAEGKGVPKSLTESYKWLAIAELWNAPNAAPLLDQVGRDLKPDEIEKAKAAAASYTFKTK